SAILKNARKSYLVADHTKFGRNAVVRGGSIRDVSAFFTDCPPPDHIEQIIDESGVALHVPEAGTDFPTFVIPDDHD
ncbi:MAG TPA: DeoR family transcriptional regulator, partial [Thalassospira sp.]|nr:DeoR family transcriptional regulator [Thalassospira sp.]